VPPSTKVVDKLHPFKARLKWPCARPRLSPFSRRATSFPGSRPKHSACAAATVFENRQPATELGQACRSNRFTAPPPVRRMYPSCCHQSSSLFPIGISPPSRPPAHPQQRCLAPFSPPQHQAGKLCWVSAPKSIGREMQASQPPRASRRASPCPARVSTPHSQPYAIPAPANRARPKALPPLVQRSPSALDLGPVPASRG